MKEYKGFIYGLQRSKYGKIEGFIRHKNLDDDLRFPVCFLGGKILAKAALSQIKNNIDRLVSFNPSILTEKTLKENLVYEI